MKTNSSGNSTTCRQLKAVLKRQSIPPQSKPNLHQAKKNTPDASFDNLNLIRALSGFIVVFSHFFQIFVLPVEGASPIRDFAMHLALYAVLAFFVLSGFLIAMSIQRNVSRKGYFDWKGYFVSRFARIYPALIASTIFCIALYAILGTMGHGGPEALARASDAHVPTRTGFIISKSEIFFTLLQTYAFGPGGYLNANGPLWSLSYEVGFYLWAGLAMVALKGRGVARALSVPIMLSLAFIACRYGKYMFLFYGTVWMLGVLLFLSLGHSARAEGFTEASSKRIKAVVLLALGVMVATDWVMAKLKPGEPLLHDFSTSLAIVAGLYGVARIRMPLATGISKMAESTYTLYLFHFPALLFTYALVRDLYSASPLLYYGISVATAVALLPLCHFGAKTLENRRLWESYLRSAAGLMVGLTPKRLRRPSDSAGD